MRCSWCGWLVVGSWLLAFGSWLLALGSGLSALPAQPRTKVPNTKSQLPRAGLLSYCRTGSYRQGCGDDQEPRQLTVFGPKPSKAANPAHLYLVRPCGLGI